jgi:hypothetical protein
MSSTLSELRLECLRLAAQQGRDPTATIAAAVSFLDFVTSDRSEDKSTAERPPAKVVS